jgi:hypothetical protein
MMDVTGQFLDSHGKRLDGADKKAVSRFIKKMKKEQNELKKDARARVGDFPATAAKRVESLLA